MAVTWLGMSAHPVSTLADLRGNSRLPVLMRMVRDLTAARDNAGLINCFVEAMNAAYGARCYVHLSLIGCKPGHFRIIRWRDADGVERVVPPDGALDAVGGGAESRGGFFGGLIEGDQPKIYVDLSATDDAVVGAALRPYRSAIAAPIFAAGVLASWAVVLKSEPGAFTERELEDFLVRANLVGTAVQHLDVVLRLREADDWIEREIDQIAEIQKALLPEGLPRVPGLTIAASYKTFNRAGGDYYDIYPLRPDGATRRWGIFISDASGHGPSAAVVMAMVNAILHTYPHEPAGPGEVLEYLNAHLYARQINYSFVTAIFGIYDPQTRELHYANAGHNPPLLRLPGAPPRIERLEHVGGVPIGVNDRVASDEQRIVLPAGSRLVLYTDGIVEERNDEEQQYTLDRLADLLAAHRGSAQEFVDLVNAELIAHQGQTPPEDDQTLIVLDVGA